MKFRRSTNRLMTNLENADIELPNPELDAATGEEDISDVVGAEADEQELNATVDEIEQTMEDLETGDVVASEIENQIEANETAIENDAVTEDDVLISNECLMTSIRTLKLDPSEIAYTKLNHEHILRNPKAVLQSNNEALGGIWEKIKEGAKKAWEYVVKLFNKVVDFLKKLLPTKKNRLEKLKKVLDKVEGSTIHKDVKDEFAENVGEKFGGMLCACENDLKKLYKLAENIPGAIEGVANVVQGDKPSSELINKAKGSEEYGYIIMDGDETNGNKDMRVKGNPVTLFTTFVKDNYYFIGVDEAIDIKSILSGTKLNELEGLLKRTGLYDLIVNEAAKQALNQPNVDKIKMIPLVISFNNDIESKVTVPELSLGTAKTLVKDRIDAIRNIDKALDKLKTKLSSNIDKVNKNTDKEISSWEKDKDDNSAEKIIANIARKSLEYNLKVARKLCKEAIMSIKDVDADTFGYVQYYARMVLKGIKQDKKEKADK